MSNFYEQLSSEKKQELERAYGILSLDDNTFTGEVSIVFDSADQAMRVAKSLKSSVQNKDDVVLLQLPGTGQSAIHIPGPYENPSSIANYFIEAYLQSTDHLQGLPITQISAGSARHEYTDVLPAAPVFHPTGLLPHLNQLGHGSYASIEALSQQIVLKSPLHVNKSQEDALREEAALLWRVESPFVVRGYGYLEPGEDNSCGGILMERCQGYPLAERIKHASIDQILCWLPQIAQAIQDLHIAQVVHFDLSPNNILVTEQNTIKVIDLGSSRLTTRDGKCADKSKSLGYGTLHYMSPEQLGLSTDDDLRPCDMYALGTLIVAMLKGEKMPSLKNCRGDLAVDQEVDSHVILYKKYRHLVELDIPLQLIDGIPTLSPALQQKYKPYEQATVIKLLQLASQLTNFDPKQRGQIDDVPSIIEAIISDYRRSDVSSRSNPLQQTCISNSMATAETPLKQISSMKLLFFRQKYNKKGSANRAPGLHDSENLDPTCNLNL